MQFGTTSNYRVEHINFYVADVAFNYRIDQQWGHLTFCHPYGWHSFVCHFYTGTYTFAIANSNPPIFLPFLLMWHFT